MHCTLSWAERSFHCATVRYGTVLYWPALCPPGSLPVRCTQSPSPIADLSSTGSQPLAELVEFPPPYLPPTAPHRKPASLCAFAACAQSTQYIIHIGIAIEITIPPNLFIRAPTTRTTLTASLPRSSTPAADQPNVRLPVPIPPPKRISLPHHPEGAPW